MVVRIHPPQPWVGCRDGGLHQTVNLDLFGGAEGSNPSLPTTRSGDEVLDLLAQAFAAVAITVDNALAL